VVLVFKGEVVAMRVFSILIVGLIGALAGFESAPVVTSTACVPVDDFALAMVSQLRSLVTTTDSVRIAARQAMQLSAGSVSQVSYVTNNATCNSAATAYYPTVIRTPPATPFGAVYVWQVGSNFGVMDSVETAGEWRIAATLSKKFKVLATYTF
jgi:hypothetical protein